MNPTLDSSTLITAMLWLLALALPLAMLLWMAAQFIAIRSLGRRVRALETAAAAEHVVVVPALPTDGSAASPTEAVADVPVDVDAHDSGAVGPVRSGLGSVADDERIAIDAAEGHA